MSLKDKYAIVGVGYTPQGRVPDRTAMSFHVEACVNAIKDAGLKKEDIDGLIAYRRDGQSLHCRRQVRQIFDGGVRAGRNTLLAADTRHLVYHRGSRLNHYLALADDR